MTNAIMALLDLIFSIVVTSSGPIALFLVVALLIDKYGDANEK